MSGLIVACASSGQLKRAWQTWLILTAKGLVPDLVAHNALLAALAAADVLLPLVVRACIWQASCDQAQGHAVVVLVTLQPAGRSGSAYQQGEQEQRQSPGICDLR